MSSKVLFLMSGSIAAYKSCHVISKLVQMGHDVQVVASSSALQFIGTATLEGLSGRPVVHDLWQQGHAMDHIHLVRWADLVLAAPATAHLINRMASGIGDDLLTTMFLAHDFKKPFLIAPAMNTRMYQHPTTQASLHRLKEMGLDILETASGVLACGETGFGKLLEPDLILKEIQKTLSPQNPTTWPSPKRSSPASESRSILMTGGGTQEAIDDVRVLTNRSTGRSASALATLFSELGFDVTLLRAKDAVAPTAPDVRQQTFVSHEDLKKTLQKELAQGTYSHVIHMAAVSDYLIDQILLNGTPIKSHKTPSGGELSLVLRPSEKLLPSLKSWSPHPLQVMAFKLTSHATLTERRLAIDKLFPDADVVVSNDLAEISDQQHPYLIKTPSSEIPASGIHELAAWTSNWILKESL